MIPTGEQRDEIINSQGSSNVAYSILVGRRSPKEISELLGIKPSSVVEQLDRLRGADLVFRAGRQGKFQYYDIEYNNLVDLLLEEAPEIYFTNPRARPKPRSPEEKRSQASRGLFAKLRSNRHFIEVVYWYFWGIADLGLSVMYPPPTIGQACLIFEPLLTQVFRNVKEKLPPSIPPELVALVKLLSRWNDKILQNDEWETFGLKHFFHGSDLLKEESFHNDLLIKEMLNRRMSGEFDNNVQDSEGHARDYDVE